MANKFERVVAATPGEAEEHKRVLTRKLEKSDMVFIRRGKNPDCWQCKREGHLIDVIAHYDKGTFVVDVPTGIRIEPGAEVAAFAYANHLQTFKYKTGELVAMGKGGEEAWVAGSDIHLRFEHPIDKQDIGRVVRIAAQTFEDCKESMCEVSGNRLGLEDAVQGKCEGSETTLIDRLLRRLAN